MKLLLSERGQIIAISNLIEYGVWGNIGESKSWKLGEHSYTMDDNYTVVEVDNNDIPLYVQPYEFYYIDGEFKVADECPNEYRDRIVKSESDIETLYAFTEELLYKQCLLELGITDEELN